MALNIRNVTMTLGFKGLKSWSTPASDSAQNFKFCTF